ncbi:MAG TPA: hypothetical protein VE262_22155 [Blastocatellia bacterium]|nr:hypothetical protein [Blastocatellia bacterium]
MYRIGMILLIAAAFLFEPSLIASSAIGSGSQEQQMQPTPTPTPSTRRNRARRGQGRRAQRAKTGVPTGVHNCLDRLIEIASADPLPAYEGQAEQIINDGLLWNDEKSKCSIGTDATLRSKLAEASNAWRMKDAAKVRTLLGEVKQGAPQT